MTKTEFFEQALCLAVSRGMNDLNRVLSEAERAWTLLNPPPPPKPRKWSADEDEKKILSVLPVEAIGGHMPVRVRDVLLQMLRRKYGVAMATGRLHAALKRLEADGTIRISSMCIELA